MKRAKSNSVGHQERRARRERLNRRLLGYTATAGAALAVAGAAGTANAEIIWDAGYSGGPAGIPVCGGWNTPRQSTSARARTLSS